MVRKGDATRGTGARWTQARRQVFLDHLAATCHVSDAARAAGIERTELYRLRRNDPTFAADWAEALALGYAMLETLLLGHVLSAGGEAVPVPLGDDATRVISVADGLKLLTNHRDAMQKSPRSAKGGVSRRMSEEETDAALAKALAAAERRVARAAGRTAKAGDKSKAGRAGEAAKTGNTGTAGEEAGA